MLPYFWPPMMGSVPKVVEEGIGMSYPIVRRLNVLSNSIAGQTG